MNTISPACADAFHLLRMDLLGYLDEAESLATKDDEWDEEDRETARRLIPDLVTVIRGMMAEHKPQPDGGCRVCSATWPCPIVTTIHALVTDPDRAFWALLRRANNDE
ncbi:MAG: hypothetical protein ACRDRU_11175 [Pseudonocardiaceae bacterium]